MEKADNPDGPDATGFMDIRRVVVRMLNQLCESPGQVKAQHQVRGKPCVLADLETGYVPGWPLSSKSESCIR